MARMDVISEPILEEFTSKDILETLDLLVNAYFMHKNNYNHWFTILKKRFGFGSEKALTLREIGEEYKVTRERIRQIIFLITNHIKDLLEGKEIRKPYIVYKNSKKLFNKIRLEFKPYQYITSNGVLQILADYSKNTHSEYTDLLMYLYGFENRFYEDKKFYYKENFSFEITRKIEHFKVFISKQALFISSTDIKNELKISQEDLEFLLEFVPDVEIKKCSEGVFYRMPVEYLRNLSLSVHRLLYETGHPLHLSVINEYLKKTLNQTILNSNCLNSDGKKIVQIGNSGMWALREWDINTESIPALLEKCFREKNRSLTMHFLLNYVNNFRETDSHTIRTVLSIKEYSHKFVGYSDGTYGLKDWNLNKSLKIKRKYNIPKIKEDAILQKSIAILNLKGKMLMIDLIQYLTKEGFVKASLYKILKRNSHIFISEKTKGRNKYIYLKPSKGN